MSSKRVGVASPADQLAGELAAALSAGGFSHRPAPVRVMAGLLDTMTALRDQGSLTAAFYDEYQPYFKFTPPLEVPEPRTIIVAAWASLPVKLRFQLDTGPLEAVVPPTYVSSDKREECLGILRSILGPAGFAVGRAAGPVKLLAVRTGLAQYGRNNLVYVPGLGSYARLDAFCTDADLGAAEYQRRGSELMSCCPPCRNCHHVCPTGCIPHAGTIIDATCCLTYASEHEGPWPEWIDPATVRCLVGCMRCQEMCPANRYYLRKEQVVAEFDREETEIILRDLRPEQLPAVLREKLQALDLDEYSPVLGRNLRALRDAVQTACS